MTPEQPILIDAVLTLPETLLEKEYQRRDRGHQRCDDVLRRGGEDILPSWPTKAPPPLEDNVSTMVKVEEPVQSRSDVALGQATLSIRTDKRPTVCFLCFRNPKLPSRDGVFAFSSPGCLSKHFSG
jgi:hypothetical protein